MKAVVYTQYGPPDVLQLKEVEKPEPRDNEIQIKVMATAVNSGDWRLRKADPAAVRLFFGLTKPRIAILGGVLSGVVEKIGRNVTRFKAGDPVFGATGMGFGAYAAYKCLPEDGVLAIKPSNISHPEAAVIPFGGTTALHFIRKAQIQRGQKVLIYGASGAVGTAAVQLAKYFGAQVTGVCSAANADLVMSLGADRVIDYIREDFTKSGEIYDVVFETVNKIPFSSCLKALHKSGVLILGASGMSEMLQGGWASLTGSRKILSGIISQTADDMNFLKARIEAGQLKAVIDRAYSLEQIVAAHDYVEKGHKKGNVVIELTDNK